MIAVVMSAFVTGFFGGLHCIGMCGGFAAACATQYGVRGTFTYSIGRMITYAAMGAVAGAFGQVLQRFTLVGLVVSGLLLLFFSARLAGVLPALPIRLPRLSRLIGRTGRAQGAGSRLLFGAATALIPCGLVYAALALPVAVGNPFQGAVVMIAFGVGTLPAMVAVGFGAFHLARLGRGVRVAMALVVLLAGTWTIVRRAPALGDDDPTPPCHRHLEQPAQTPGDGA